MDVVDAFLQFILDKGGWGAWFLTICYGVFSLLRGHVLPMREHEGRLEDHTIHYNQRIRDYQERLEAEIRENEWLRDALLSSTEMGAILTKSKASFGGRRHTDEAE